MQIPKKVSWVALFHTTSVNSTISKIIISSKDDNLE